MRFTPKSKASPDIGRQTIDDLAALVVSTSWPSSGKQTAVFNRSLAASFDAMELYIDADDARAAFVEAARAAGMHVLPDDMAEMKMVG